MFVGSSEYLFGFVEFFGLNEVLAGSSEDLLKFGEFKLEGPSRTSAGSSCTSSISCLY
jgi:hypothetical protein